MAMLYAIQGSISLQKMKNPTVLHIKPPHTEHTVLRLHGTAALQRITLISTRQRERERGNKKKGGR